MENQTDKRMEYEREAGKPECFFGARVSTVVNSGTPKP